MADQRTVPPDPPIIIQQRSLIGTREWLPKTPISEHSIIRNHSPYCESTGPIVHEGFVASRIRALQGFLNVAHSKPHSHSPMTPCPPRSLRKQRVRAPPMSVWSKNAFVRSSESLEVVARGQLQEKLEVVLDNDEKLLGRLPAQLDRQFNAMLPRELHGSQKRPDIVQVMKADHVDGIIPPQAQDDSVEPPPFRVFKSPIGDALATDQPNNTDDAILSPRAIPASLANPFTSWKDASGTELCNSQASPLRTLRPKISIADKLGSLVERGWIGMDVFGKAYDDRHMSDGVTSDPHMHNTRVKHRSRSSGVEARSFTLPLRRKLPLRTAFKGQSASDDFTVLKASNSDEAPTRSAIVSQRKRTHQSHGHLSQKRSGPRRRDHDLEQFMSDDFDPDPRPKRRVFSIQRLTRLKGSRSQSFELANISPTRSLSWRSGDEEYKAIKHFLSSGNIVSSSKQTPLERQNKERGEMSDSVSIEPSLRRTSTHTSLSTRGTKRSMSWFKRYRFLPKLVDSDYPPLLWDFSKTQSTNTPTDKTEIDSQYRAPRNPRQDPQDTSRVQKSAGGGHEDEDGGIRAQQGEAILGLVLRDAPSGRAEVKTTPQEDEKHLKWEQFQLRTKTSRAFGLEGSQSHASTGVQERASLRKPGYFSETSSNPLPEHSPPRSKHASKTNSTDRTYETAASPEQHVRPSLETSQASSPSSSVRLRYNDWPELLVSPAENETPRPKSPADPLLRRREYDVEVVQPSSAGATVSASPSAVRRERKVSSGSVKKIQVTITFDGAGELVIDAKLQGRGGLDQWSSFS